MRQDMVAANVKQAFRVKVKFPCELPTNIAIFNLARIYGQVFKLFCKIEKLLPTQLFWQEFITRRNHPSLCPPGDRHRSCIFISTV
jgi:hypothetical protein